MSSSSRKLVICPNCAQEFDKEDDHCIYLHVCESFICVSCCKDHLKECPVSLASNDDEEAKRKKKRLIKYCPNDPDSS